MAIDLKQFEEYVIVPTLKYLSPEIPFSQDAVELLKMTMCHESDCGRYLKQIKGPALSPYQMEPPTYHDIWDNFIHYNSGLCEKLNRMLPECSITPPERGLPVDLVTNLAYSTAMARVHYYRVPEALPSSDDVEAMAKYAKKYYNTHLGKARWEDYRDAYLKYNK